MQKAAQESVKQLELDKKEADKKAMTVTTSANKDEKKEKDKDAPSERHCTVF
jgi:hypothetical protein